MSARSAIEWTNSSWNPIRARREDGRLGWHCERVSEGCRNCYAETMNKRLGTSLPYVRSSRDRSGIFLDEKVLTQPLRWRKPRKIFVCSMSDLFAEFVPDDWLDRIFAVMALAAQHTFQVLTKRAVRMREYLSPERPGRIAAAIDFVRLQGSATGWEGWPLPNAWLGVSAEDQQQLDERMPELLATPAAVRFVSAEPLLGPLSFDGDMYSGPGYLRGWHVEPKHWSGCDGSCSAGNCPEPDQVRNKKLDWVIIGGESGTGARPMNSQWARDIVRQCKEAGVPVFVKQMGRNPIEYIPVEPDETFYGGKAFNDPNGGRASAHGYPRDDIGRVRVYRKLASRKGGDPSEWPEDLRVREFPRRRAVLLRSWNPEGTTQS